MDQDLVIQTNRLLLYTVLPSEYEVLAVDQADPNLWLDRGFSDPDKYFLNNPNPISKIQNINQYFYQKYSNLENMSRLNRNQISSQMGFNLK